MLVANWPFASIKLIDTQISFECLQSMAVLFVQCQFNSAYCTIEDHFDAVSTNMGFCMSFNPGKNFVMLPRSGEAFACLLVFRPPSKRYYPFLFDLPNSLPKIGP